MAGSDQLSSGTISQTTEDGDEEGSHVLCSIPEFYKGSSVFITGATGFIGKSVLEKLLRACPDIDKIFLLIRIKKGMQPEERVKSMLELKLFEKVRSLRSLEQLLKTIVPLEGDMSADNLGISTQDESLLMKSNVRFVIHSAATIKFDEPLKVALTVNTLGTLKVIQLSRKLPHLKCIVHVSTAYSNCDLTHIEEKIYKSQFNPSKVIDALDWVPDKALDMITPVLIGSKPNTYTFTKQLAENLFVEENESRQLPYVIVRPTIVGASLNEPFRGWIDNYSGASGLFVACGMGVLRSMMAYPDAVANLVPVDIVADIVIGAPWYREEHNRRQLSLKHHHNYTQPYRGTTQHSRTPPDMQQGIRDAKDTNMVINCESGYIKNPLVWDTVPKLIEKFYCQNPFEKAVRYPRFRVTNSRLKNHLYTMFSHNAVALVMDLLLKCMGQKPKMTAMYQKLHRSLESLEFFTQHYWQWEVNNLKEMDLMLETVRRKGASSSGPLSKDSQNWAKEWNLSMQGIDWSKYIEFYCLGTKKFVMKEEMSKVSRARRRIQLLKLIHYTTIAFSTLIGTKLAQLLYKLIVRFYRIVQSSGIISSVLPKINHAKKLRNSVST